MHIFTSILWMLGIGLIAILVTFITTHNTVSDIYQKAAIEHNCAEYSQTTGEWQWITAEEK